MPVRVPLEFATDTMRLVRPVTDGDGRVVAGAGTRLDARIRRLLRRLAIQTVVVDEAAGVDGWEAVQPLPEALAALDARCGTAARAGALAALHDAVARHLARRAARCRTEDDGA